MKSFVVEDIPDLTEMTVCMWLNFRSDWDSNGYQRMYLVAYDVNESNQLTADSFFAGLDGNINLVFGVGNGGQAW